jgi:hypothetical protein
MTDPATVRALCDKAMAKATEFGVDFKTGKWKGGKDPPQEWKDWVQRFWSSLDEETKAEVQDLWDRAQRQEIIPVLEEPPPAKREFEFDWTADTNVLWTEQGILTKLYPPKGDPKLTPIIGGRVEPLGRAIVDGVEKIEFFSDGGGYTATTLPEMIKSLRNRGCIFDRSAEGILSFVVSKMATKSRIVHSCYGVYDDVKPPYLTMNFDCHPTSDDQKLTFQTMSPNFNFSPFKNRYIDSYEEFNDLFKPFEIRPILGASVMGSYNELLRSDGRLCPDLYDWSFNSDTGKTGKAKVYTELMYGMLSVEAEAIEKPFRMGYLREAYNGILGINEVENLKREVWSSMKTAPESKIALRRGTPSLGMVLFKSRATFNMTANRLMIRRPDQLKRLIVVHSTDDLSELQNIRWKHKSKYDQLMGSLKPIGYRLQAELLSFNPVFRTRETLVQEIARNSLTIRKIAKADDHPLMSSRCDIWGHNYTGNRAWDWLCKHCDAPHESLSPEEYYEQVVKPNDIATFESAQDAVGVFLEWFSGWRSKNARTRRSYDGPHSYVDIEYIQGENELFTAVSLPVPGYYVTEFLVEAYNKENPDNQFGSLKGLTLQAADYAGIDAKEVLGSDEFAKVIKLKELGQSRRVAFVPKSFIPNRKVASTKESEEEDQDDDLEEDE